MSERRVWAGRLAKFLITEIKFAVARAGMQRALDSLAPKQLEPHMNPVLFFTVTLSASAIAHYSIVFLEPAKASVLKAVALNALLVIGSNLARSSGFSPEPILEWAVYIVVTAGFVRALYRLKLLNSVTVGACYVAGSYVLAHAVDAATNTFVS